MPKTVKQFQRQIARMSNQIKLYQEKIKIQQTEIQNLKHAMKRFEEVNLCQK